jgi:hypothetical protein
MIPILVIGGIVLVVALTLGAAIAPRKRPLVADLLPWRFEEHDRPVERSEIQEDDLV